MKKILLIVIISIILIAAIFFISQKYNRNIADKSVQLSVVPVIESDNFFRIHVEYPQFENVNPAFNQKISSLITQKLSDFKKNSQDNWEARKATALPVQVIPDNPEVPFDFIATWTPTQLNNQYLSFVMDIYYFSGGAHGINETYAFNYDVSQKKEISILDFLNSSQDSLDKVADLSGQNITSKFESEGVEMNDTLKQMIQQGTTPTLENFQNFNFTYNSLIIYFQQYQVAPGSFGSITVTIFKNSLDSNSIASAYLEE